VDLGGSTQVLWFGYLQLPGVGVNPGLEHPVRPSPEGLGLLGPDVADIEDLDTFQLDILVVFIDARVASSPLPPVLVVPPSFGVVLVEDEETAARRLVGRLRGSVGGQGRRYSQGWVKDDRFRPLRRRPLCPG